MGDRRRARLAQLVGLRLATAFGDSLGEVGEQHREPEPGGDETGEHVLLTRRVGEVLDEEDGDEDAAELDHEHHRVASHAPRVELEHALTCSSPEDRGIEKRLGLAGHGQIPSCSRIGPRARTGK